MAKLEQVISGDFYEVLGKIERGIVEGSMSASLEEFSDFESGTARCSVRVFERYSYVGDNRVSNSFSEWKRTDSTFCDCCRWQSGNAFQDQYLG